MDHVVRMDFDGAQVSMPMVTLRAVIPVSNEQLERSEWRAAEVATEMLRREARSWQAEGWQFAEDPVMDFEEDFLRLVMEFRLTVRAFRRPGEWTAVDTQVLADTGDRGI